MSEIHPAPTEFSDDEIERLRADNARLQGVLKRIEIASQFYAQEGVADYAMRSAHESTMRLASAALDGKAQ